MNEKKLFTLDEINDFKGKNEMFIEGDFVAILDNAGRLRRLFVKKEEGYDEVDAKRLAKECAKYISSKIDLSQAIEDKLRHLTGRWLLELHARIQKKPEVKKRRGCFSVFVKGKQGPPLELDLVD